MLPLAGGNLNIEILPEPDNEVSRIVFEKKMREGYIGISPGFNRIKDKCKADVDGSEHLVINLNELSLCTNPVHKGSMATLSHDIDLRQVKKQVDFERRWLADL